MVQAARSGTQNIAEGSRASGTSKKTELKLTNVARSSLEELMLNYEDYLRQRGWELWERSDSRRQELVDRRCETADEVAKWVKLVHGREKRMQGSPQLQTSTRSTKSTPSMPPDVSAIAANAIHVIIAAANSLLDKQLSALAQSFVDEGGFTERLYRVRSKARQSPRRGPDARGK